MDKKSFTLMEIVVSTVILAITMAGAANIFLAAKRHSLHSRSQMTGGELGKYFLDPLQNDVRQDQWGTNCLSTDRPPNSSICDTYLQTWTDPVSGIQYTPQYEIGAGPLTNLRKVKLTLRWSE